jgi:hypothetical protein
MLPEQRNDCARQASACETEIAARDRVGNLPPKFLLRDQKKTMWAIHTRNIFQTSNAGTIALLVKVLQSAMVFIEATKAR